MGGSGGCCIANCCVGESVKSFFRDVFGSSSSGGCGYHPGPSETEAHAKKIADELAAMKDSIRKSSEKQEQSIIDYINKSMNEMIELLEQVNKNQYGGKSLNINIEGIRKENEKLKNQVVGAIGNYMDERLVLTDKELSVILAERDDKKRNKNFDAFCDRVKTQSLSKLREKIVSTVRSQENMIRHEISIRLNEVDNNMKAATKAYTEIVRIKDEDESKMAETHIKYIYQHGLSEILLDQLED